MKKIKTSVLARSAQLLGVASKIAGHELTQKFKNQMSSTLENHAPEILKTRVAQAKILAENLSQLKGAAMKVGQLLSIDASDLIPPEVLEVLSQLQSMSEPVDYSQIQPVIEQQLSQDILKQVQIEKVAFSAASIGQVHRARYKEQDLALKIQYPKVNQTIDSDLLILKKTVGAFLKLSQRPMELDGLFQELSVILHQETDYVRERDLLSRYKRLIEENNLSGSYIVPNTVAELSTKKILAMSFEKGLSIQEWLATNPEAIDRRIVGERLLNLYCYEFFQWGLVQTDPNFGNFLVREKNKIVLLDFGATQEFSKSFVDGYRDVLKAFGTMDEKKIIDASIHFNLIDERENQEARFNYAQFMKLTIEPFSPNQQPFAFYNQDYTKRTIELGRKFTSSLRYSPPPKHIIFLHRKLGGIFNLLKKMQVELDLTPYWQKMVQSEFSRKDF